MRIKDYQRNLQSIDQTYKGNGTELEIVTGPLIEYMSNTSKATYKEFSEKFMRPSCKLLNDKFKNEDKTYAVYAMLCAKALLELIRLEMTDKGELARRLCGLEPLTEDSEVPNSPEHWPVTDGRTEFERIKDASGLKVN